MQLWPASCYVKEFICSGSIAGFPYTKGKRGLKWLPKRNILLLSLSHTDLISLPLTIPLTFSSSLVGPLGIQSYISPSYGSCSRYYCCALHPHVLPFFGVHRRVCSKI